MQVLDRHTIGLRVWERGAGETLACGSGACAAVAVASAFGDGNVDIAAIQKLYGANYATRAGDRLIVRGGERIEPGQAVSIQPASLAVAMRALRTTRSRVGELGMAWWAPRLICTHCQLRCRQFGAQLFSHHQSCKGHAR